MYSRFERSKQRAHVLRASGVKYDLCAIGGRRNNVLRRYDGPISGIDQESLVAGLGDPEGHASRHDRQ